jgi:hypothetical protein
MEYTKSSYEGATKNGRYQTHTCQLAPVNARRIEGKGTYTFPSGTQYVGDFKDGEFVLPQTSFFF